MIIVFRPHSIVDVITNSSSELFIFKPRDNSDFIEFLEQISYLPRTDLFDYYLGNVTVAEEDFYYVVDTFEANHGKLFDYDFNEKNYEKYSRQMHKFTNFVSTKYPSLNTLAHWYEPKYRKQFDVKKGDYLVHSAGDNTIPGDLMDIFEEYAVNRFHLG